MAPRTWSRTSTMRASTSSARPPGSAWMKLACLVDTSAGPTRRPLAPATSMSRPAESPSGLVNTEPAFGPAGLVVPPPAHDLGDLGRRRVGVARRQARTSARTTTCVGTRPTSGGSRGPGRRRAPHSSSPVRRSRRRTSTRVAAMSEPWPPAFMRTAAADRAGHAHGPLEAGQAGGGRLAGQHRQGGGAAGATVGAVDRRRRRTSPPSRRASPGKPASATSRLEPLPTTRTGTASGSAARASTTAAGRSRPRPRRTPPPGPRPGRW